MKLILFETVEQKATLGDQTGFDYTTSKPFNQKG